VHARCLTPVITSELFVGIEPSDPTDPASAPLARLYTSKAEAEYHTPFVLSFAEYMAGDDDSATLVI
jgi:hypothetical protein